MEKEIHPQEPVYCYCKSEYSVSEYKEKLPTGASDSAAPNRKLQQEVDTLEGRPAKTR